MRPIVAAIVLAWPSLAAAAPSFEEIVIKGEVQKPEIVVVISRENLNKNYQLELKESFVDRILEAAQQPPF